MAARTTHAERQLACRLSGGLEIRLLWNQETGELTVTVFDTNTGELLQLPARRDRALDVFNHPFAYAARTDSPYAAAIAA